MRPYLAVLKDSFREALASRVLWILLVLATGVLAAIAPLGLSERAAAWLLPRDVRQPQALIEKLRAQGSAAEATPGERVWQRLSADLQQGLKSYPRPASPGRPAWMVAERLRGELNTLLEDATLYDAEAWRGIELDPEAMALLNNPPAELPEEDVARLNRLLLEGAFPQEIAASKQTVVRFTYLGMQLGSLPMQKEPLIRGALTGFVNLFVGVLGVFAGIVVTASIVPQTFEAGAIDLLLSKPISRVLLFLTKFLGGCAFILILGVYFLGGLWLIVGLRYGLWSGKLLMCIPVFMFLFAIYYSVSVLSGVLWRNAIVSVVMTILFWGVCFGVGSSKVVVEQVFLNPARLVRLVPAGLDARKDLLAMNESGETLAWDAGRKNWQEVFSPPGDQPQRGPFQPAPTTIGPVYDAQENRLLAIQSSSGAMGSLSGGSVLLVGPAAERFKRIEGPAAPEGPRALWVDASGGIFCIGSAGIFRLEGSPTEKQQKVNVLGFELAVDDKGGRFVDTGPTLQLGPRARAAVHPQSYEVAVYDQPRLSLYARQESGRYQLRLQAEIDAGKSALVALSGAHVLLAGESGRIQLVNAADLKPQEELHPFQANAPRFTAASGDGRYFGVLFHHGKLWLYDVEGRAEMSSFIAGQGDISAVTMVAGDRLLVADQGKRVCEYNLDTQALTQRWQSRLETLELVYRYLLRPIYTVFPKPGELDSLVAYLLSEEETVAMGNAEDLAAARLKLNIWEPFWSSLAFLAVVLALGCLYVHRKDF